MTAMQGNGDLAAVEARRQDGIPRTLDITLDPPIEWDSKFYDVLHLREPTGRMLLLAEGELTGDLNPQKLRKFQLALISQASGEPRQVIERLPASVIREAFNFLAKLSGGYPQIGESLPPS
jgi:hypothetical protein